MNFYAMDYSWFIMDLLQEHSTSLRGGVQMLVLDWHPSSAVEVSIIPVAIETGYSLDGEGHL